MLALGFYSSAQKLSRPLHVYDTLPDMTLQMVNYPSQTVQLNEFRGKLLILDFWSIWCANCIEEFPKIAVLQERYKDEIMILPIGFQSSWADGIRRFYDRRNEKGIPLNIPSAIQDKSKGDTVLNNLFPSQAIPLLVWVDFRGQIMGVTSQHALNAETIEGYLRSQRVVESNMKELEESHKKGLD